MQFGWLPEMCLTVEFDVLNALRQLRELFIHDNKHWQLNSMIIINITNLWPIILEPDNFIICASE